MRKEKNVLKYISIYNELKTAILNEKYPRGSFLPPESDLMDLYSVSRTTIRRAINLLQNEGFVKVQQGRGTEVINYSNVVAPYNFHKYPEIIKIFSRPLIQGESSTQGAVVDIISADIHIAKALSVDIGTDVFRIQRIRMIGDIIFAYIVSYVPCHLAPGLEQYSGKILRLYDCLSKNYDLKLKHAEEYISADTSKFLESRLLNIPIGSSILIFYRTAYCENGIMEYAESYFRPDAYQIGISFQGDIDFIDADQSYSEKNENMN